MRRKNYIANKWLSFSKKRFPSYNPRNQKKIGGFPLSGKEDIEKAITAAYQAFLSWKDLPVRKRANYIKKALRLLEKEKKNLASIVYREGGKTENEAEADVQMAIGSGYMALNDAPHLKPYSVRSCIDGKNLTLTREPYGVWGIITPWNFPMGIIGWKIFPALICGNTVIVKPSSETPACANAFLEAIEKAKIPKGVINIIHGRGKDLGDYLIGHESIKGISFTGSTSTGLSIGKKCTAVHKPAILEMGGNNPAIVDNGNLEKIVSELIEAALGNSGQRCTATSRIFIKESIYEKFKNLFVQAAKSVAIGPLISIKALDKVYSSIESAKQEGAKVLCGSFYPMSRKGNYLEPTVFENVDPNSEVFAKEIFGPVVALYSYSNFLDAIHYANSIPYGLTACVYTKSRKKAKLAERLLEAGTVNINSSTIDIEYSLPFPGWKGSGSILSEGGSPYGSVLSYTKPKVIGKS